MATATGTLNTNSIDDTAAELAITTETLITLYVLVKTGTSLNHCIIFEISPDDGTTWLPIPPPLTGVGILTQKVAATKVRCKVIKTEGATSTVDVHIVAL